MNYRTDLAVEADELLEDAERADETRSGAELSARRAAGYIKKQRQLDEDIAVIEIEILNEEGEKAFQRPRGTYVTIEIQGLFEEKENIRERASRAVAAELARDGYAVCINYYERKDKAGELVKVASIIAKENGNVIKLEHNQFVSINRINAVELRVTMEAYGTEHKLAILKALKDGGYEPELVDTKLY